jgi:ABC-type antimicrobial peptide transport system permease subunit
LLAAIGLYGVLSFSVAQRTKEIGIRMALGASRENISALVIRQVGYLITAGLVAGAGLGWLAVRLLRSEVSNLQCSPVWPFVGAGLALIGVMLLAGYIPAWRAATVEPMEALRAE